MYILRKLNLYAQIEGIRPQFRMVVDRVDNLDTLFIEVELDSRLIGDTVKDLERLKNVATRKLSEGLLLRCDVKLCLQAA